MKTAIIIPARFGSTRLPGKPLALIQNQTLLQRVVRLSKAAAADLPNVSIMVATDDERIVAHCNELQVEAIFTPTDLATGTDRIAYVVRQLADKPDFILNMQGDAPFTPPHFLRALIESYRAAPTDAVTPVTKLTWHELDALREQKRQTPFSGTTAVFNQRTGQGLWFSKQIIPAMRKEHELRKSSLLSPVYRHIGLYGYSKDMLAAFIQLPEGEFEALEGLEQLRLLEHGYTLRCVPVHYNGLPSMSGIDSPEDILRAEALIKQFGEL